MQVLRSVAALGLLLASAVSAENVGDWCDHNLNGEHTLCDSSRTNIMYCNGNNSQWTWAYACPAGCCGYSGGTNGGHGGAWAVCTC
ncbi:hypothetical protein NLG97_g2804 [Lecanicillium saksenae]|uniref:Uncharacterized protein n=1 Tax=Lecanicillium saksenae TaxID=468837 RepID=A0ACC1R2H1_9HYPO|nr:hypothetical protein NLG97_g2804 [Lecanicillium saksenae]